MIEVRKLGAAVGLLVLHAFTALAADIEGVPDFSKSPPHLRNGTSWLVVVGVVALTAGGLLAYVYFRDWHVARVYRRRPRQQSDSPANESAAAKPARQTIIMSNKRVRQSATAASMFPRPSPEFSADLSKPRDKPKALAPDRP